MSLLYSCKGYVRQDGPPDFYVDETRIPNAIPKPEPLAKYGNMPSYSVFGKRYYVMPSSKNYEATGRASWYGTKFHAQRTSSGEPYNMLSMTAAHKTLPLPTYLEVTNLANHRTIIVKVNDRGPFEGNRLLDLSYVAAKKLGMLGKGTTNVKIRAIDPEAPYLPTQSAPNETHTMPFIASHERIKPFYFQVGAFKNKDNAEKLHVRLLHLLAAPVKILQPQRFGQLYRVQVGPIEDMAARDKIFQRLKMLGMHPTKIS